MSSTTFSYEFDHSTFKGKVRLPTGVFIAGHEALDNGKTFKWAKTVDVKFSMETIRYYAGWADKIHGQVIETHEGKLSYTRHEPIGVVGQIIPWNFPRM